MSVTIQVGDVLAGTTGLVADRLGRDALLIELNPDYAAMAQERIRGDGGWFGGGEVVGGQGHAFGSAVGVG